MDFEIEKCTMNKAEMQQKELNYLTKKLSGP